MVELHFGHWRTGSCKRTPFRETEEEQEFRRSVQKKGKEGFRREKGPKEEDRSQPRLRPLQASSVSWEFSRAHRSRAAALTAASRSSCLPPREGRGGNDHATRLELCPHGRRSAPLSSRPLACTPLCTRVGGRGPRQASAATHPRALSLHIRTRRGLSEEPWKRNSALIGELPCAANQAP